MWTISSWTCRRYCLAFLYYFFRLFDFSLRQCSEPETTTYHSTYSSYLKYVFQFLNNHNVQAAISNKQNGILHTINESQITDHSISTGTAIEDSKAMWAAYFEFSSELMLRIELFESVMYLRVYISATNGHCCGSWPIQSRLLFVADSVW